MTDLRQAAQQALEALCSAVEPKNGKVYARGFEPIDCYAMHEQAITARRTALEQDELYEGFSAIDVKSTPEYRIARGEPVAWIRDGTAGLYVSHNWDLEYTLPLFAHPPQRPWVGLTDEEMSDIVADIDVDFGDLLWKVVCLTKIIETELKERNT